MLYDQTWGTAGAKVERTKLSCSHEGSFETVGLLD